MTRSSFNYLLALIFLALIPTPAITQTPEDFAFRSAGAWRNKLSLNDRQTADMEAVLLRFNEGYRQILAARGEKDQGFQAAYELLVEKRNQELSEILDPQQMDKYQELQQGRINEMKLFYERVIRNMNEDRGFFTEVKALNQDIMLPVLLSERSILDAQISADDQALIRNYGESFREMLREFALQTEQSSILLDQEEIDDVLRMLARQDVNNRATVKGIRKMMKKYKNPLDQALIELEPFRSIWQNEMKAIFANYLPPGELESTLSTLEVLGVFGISGRIDELVFFLFDPDDGSTYFELNRNLHILFFRGMAK